MARHGMLLGGVGIANPSSEYDIRYALGRDKVLRNRLKQQLGERIRDA
ncbi:MAG: hypothetical protein GPOALKHO_001515 [Sodalis sp.]|nr:MAG: hypothetical protein GPOALKHO_001515 [Sodalis sp.]